MSGCRSGERTEKRHDEAGDETGRPIWNERLVIADVPVMQVDLERSQWDEDVDFAVGQQRS
jgi:hypothetical protein